MTGAHARQSGGSPRGRVIRPAIRPARPRPRSKTRSARRAVSRGSAGSAVPAAGRFGGASPAPLVRPG